VIPEDENLVVGATEDIEASPNFTLYPDIVKVAGELFEDKDKVTLLAPDYRIVDEKHNTWIISVTTGNLKETIGKNDVVISGLPRGLTASVSKVSGEDNQIQIQLTGTASSTVADNTVVKVKVTGTAVTEPNSIDSDEIELKLIRGSSMIEEL